MNNMEINSKLNIVKLKIEEKKYNEALDILLEENSIHNVDFDLNFEIAKLFFIVKNFEYVKTILLILIDNDCFNKDVLEMLFKINLNIGQNYLNKVLCFIEKNFQEEAILFLEIAKYFLDKDKINSIKYLNKYIESGGTNLSAIVLLSKLYAQCGDNSSGKKILERIPYSKEYNLFDFVDNFILKSDFNNAVENFQSVLNYIDIDSYDGKFLLMEIVDKIIVTKIFDINLPFDEKQSWIGLIEQYFDLLQIEYRIKVIKKISIYYKEKGFFYKAIDLLSTILYYEEIDLNTIKFFYSILRQIDFNEVSKSKVIKILKELIKNIKIVKYQNIILNELEIIQKKTKLLSKPRQMQVLLTTNCNIKCVMCDVRKTNYILSDGYLKVIKEYMPYLEKIMWTGGEVLMYKNFYDLLELAAKYDIQQSFITNGLLLNEKFLNLVSKYDISFAISVDAVEKKLYEKIRQGSDFDKLLDNLKKISTYSNTIKKLDYKMAVVLMSNNYKYINEFVKFAIKYGFNAIMFQQYISYGDDTLKLTQEQESFVIKIIRCLKELSCRKEIPLEIITKYNLFQEDVQDYKEIYDVIKVEQFKNIEVYNEYKLIEKQYFSNIDIEQKKDFINPGEKLICFENIDNNNETIESTDNKKLVCVAPWDSIFLGPNCAQFSSYCKNLDRNIENIWNSDEVIEYRKKIADNKLFKECKYCQNMGDIAENNRQGKK